MRPSHALPLRRRETVWTVDELWRRGLPPSTPPLRDTEMCSRLRIPLRAGLCGTTRV